MSLKRMVRTYPKEAETLNFIAKAPGEYVLAGRLAVCGFWDMRPAFSTHLSVH